MNTNEERMSTNGEWRMANGEWRMKLWICNLCIMRCRRYLFVEEVKNFSHAP